MPNAKASGTPLVICSGLDIKTIYIDADGRAIEEDHSASDYSSCPYATLATFIPVDHISFTYAEVFLTATGVFSWYAQFAHNPKFLIPHAIGPPHLI